MLGRTSNKALKSFFDRELESLNVVTVHRELAVAAALELCAEEGIRPPSWVVREASQLLIRLLLNEKTKKRGRAAGLIARYRQDHWDGERYEAVEEIRRIRDRVKKEIGLIREYGDRVRPKHKEHYERFDRWFRRHGTYECASMYLKGRDARASAQTIKRSYRETKRRHGNKPKPDRYITFDDRFLRKLGLPAVSDRKGGNKWSPLYNLTP